MPALALEQPHPTPAERDLRRHRSHAACQVLSCLRGDASERPTVDTGLAGGLREWLEDAVAPFGDHCVNHPMIITKRSLRAVGDGSSESAAVTRPLVVGSLMDALFRQFVTTGRIDDPNREALEAIKIDPSGLKVARYLEGLSLQDRRSLQDEVADQCAVLVSTWPSLSPTWMPRTQERISIPLAGGSVVLVGVVDLIVGSPSTGQASVGLVEAKSAGRWCGHRDELRFYALLETLRSGAPPFRIATYYTRTGDIDVEDVTEEMLVETLQQVLVCAKWLWHNGSQKC